MSTRQQAEHLAAIKLRFPLWSVRPVCGGTGWTGHRGTRRVRAATLDGLETEMSRTQRGMGADPSHVLGRLQREHPAWTITTVPCGWAAEHRDGHRLHYVFCYSAEELADALGRTEP